MYLKTFYSVTVGTVTMSDVTSMQMDSSVMF